MPAINPLLISLIKKEVEEAVRGAISKVLKSKPSYIKARSSTITLQKLEPDGYNISVTMTLFSPGGLDENSQTTDPTQIRVERARLGDDVEGPGGQM